LKIPGILATTPLINAKTPVAYIYIMDILQNYTIPFYLFAAPHIHDAYTTTSSTLHPLWTSISPILLPLLDQLATYAQAAPAILSVGIFVLLLFLLLQIISFARRLMAWGIRLVFWATFWGAVVMLASVVWQRGLGRTASDVVEWGREINEVFWREYERAEGNKAAQRGMGTARGKGSWR